MGQGLVKMEAKMNVEVVLLSMAVNVGQLMLKRVVLRLELRNPARVLVHDPPSQEVQEALTRPEAVLVPDPVARAPEDPVHCLETRPNQPETRDLTRRIAKTKQTSALG